MTRERIDVEKIAREILWSLPAQPCLDRSRLLDQLVAYLQGVNETMEAHRIDDKFPDVTLYEKGNRWLERCYFYPEGAEEK